ncbi:hypothetical protein [Delftia sp. PE138]|uniref:hypothetical protein n=1 Tax=Delftia sp. PE138 TaxID=1812483 RepID=UPI0020169D9B|nr:hypothetical protein [Delftia sp. PE138]
MPEQTEVFPGVLRHLEYRMAVYVGQAQALIAAGLVTQQQLPGQAGNGRGMCTYDADGSKVHRGCARSTSTGRKYIVAKRCAEGLLMEVRLVLSPERLEAIDAQSVRTSSCWPFPVAVGHIPNTPTRPALLRAR